MVRLDVLAAFSRAPMIDFLMANFFTESGGLVVKRSWAAYEGFRIFGFDRLEAAVFCELSLSLLLMTTVPNSKVSLLGVSMSISRRGLPLLLMLDLSWEVGCVFLLLLPEPYNYRLVLLVADCFLSPRLVSEVGCDCTWICC